MAAAVGALLFETVRTRGSLQAKPLLWSACIAVAIAGYTTYDGWVIVERGLDPIAYYAVGTVIQVVLWSVIVHGKYAEGLRQARTHAGTVAALAVLIPTSYVLSLYATLHAPVSLVAAVRSSSLIWVALSAALVLREPIGRVRIAATILAAAAVVAMVV
jgi:drug/metabolite transporter (DMT)-like permease